MPTPTGSPETPEPAQRAGSARSGRRRDRTQHDRRHGEDVVSDEPDSQGETLARARGDSRGQRRVRFGQVRGFVGCNSFANVMRGLLLAATAMLVLIVPATEVKAQTVNGICSRTAEVQTALLDATSRTACADVTATDLVAVTSLTVNNYSGTVLDPADFAGLTGLTSLRFSGDSAQLTTVPDNAFAGVTALTTLDFSFLENVTTVAADAFNGLTALETLNLSYNKLETLPEDAFDGLTALRILDLSYNVLTSLHENIFDGLTALEELHLSFNTDMAALDADIFGGLIALHTLQLGYTGQTTLHADIFDGLTALIILNLSANFLTTLDADIFDGLTALETLALNRNLFTTLDADIFDGLTALIQVYLSGNLLTTLDADLFDGRTALREILLDHNSLDTLDANLFDGLTALEELQLQDNRLTALVAGLFTDLTALDSLDLNCNYFTALDLDIFDPFAATLLELNLQSDSFTTTPTETAIRAKFTNIDTVTTGVTTCLRVTVAPTSLTVTEGATGTYTVALRAPPSDNVMVAISSDNTKVTLSPAGPLTFTASDWDTPQMVTVSAAQDTDDADESATLILDPSGSDYDSVSSTALTVVVVDDDEPPVTLVSNATKGSDASSNITGDRAQAFTTGAAGATLSSVEIISEDPEGDDVAVSLCTVDGSGYPTSNCTALTAPSSFAAGTLVFTAPANTTLAANTTYSLLVVSPGGSNLTLDATFSNSEDAGGATGWIIADDFDYKTGSNAWDANSSSASLRITIKGTITASVPTVATAILDQTATTGTAFDYMFPAATFTDADGDTLTYTATLDDNSALPSWLSFAPATRTFSGTPTAADVGTVSVKVTASDGDGGSVSDTFDIVVDLPTLVSNAGQGAPASFGVAQDRSQAFTTGAAGATLSSVEIISGDTAGDAAAVSLCTVDVNNHPVSTCTELTAPPSFAAGTLVFRAPANTTLAATTTYSLLVVSPGRQSLTLDVTTSDNEDTGGATDWSIANAFDYKAGSMWTDNSNSWALYITIKGTLGTTTTNAAPTVATAIPDQTATAGTAFSYQVPDTTFADADGDTLTYTATLADDMALPAWLSFTAATRTFSGTPQAADVETVSVKVTASDGNGGSVSDTFDIVVDLPADTTAPRVASIVRETPTSSPTNADSLTWRVTFSEAVSNVDAADFAVSGTTATVTAVATVSGVTGAYDVTASGGDLASVNGTVALTISSSHNIQDAASNALSNTAPTGTNDNSYVLDNAAPIVTISGLPSASNAPFTATFTFSEAVTGFAVGDITLTNASVSNFTATSTTVYTALVTPTASGTVTVNVPANAAQDAVGNGNTAVTLATTIYTPPAITIVAGTSPVTEGTPAVFTLSRAGSTTAALTVNVTVSETGGDMVAASNEGARTVAFLANSATATLSVATASDSVDEANSVVTATISADTGSPASYSVATPASAMVTVEDNDTRGVTVSATALTVNEGTTGTYTVVLNSQPTASVTVTPSRTGSSDVTFSPPTLTFTASTWDTVQQVTVTAAQDNDAVNDSATISHAVTGGDYAGVTVDSVVVTVDDDETADTTAPRVASITRQNPTVSPTNADSLTWRVTFSEAVSNVDAADFVVSGTTATVTAVAAVSGVTGAYDVTASGGNLASVNATVALTISSSHNIQDAASNALSNTAPTGTNDNSYVLDNTAPIVTISGVPSASNAPFTATFTFSEAVTGFAVGDITLTNATVSNFTATSTTVYTALVTPTASGTVTVNVPANAAQDAVGNGNTAATLATTIYTPPAITIVAGTSPVTEGTSAVFTLSRAGSTTAALTVNVTVSETGGDMVAASNEGARTVAFLANSATATLSVATASDSVDEANSVVTATISADTGSPVSYSVGTPSSAMVTVQDNDIRDVTVSTAALTVNEGTMGTYTVVLDSQPTANVTVTPSRTGSSDVTFSPATLTFTALNWNTVQPVTVTAAQDNDAVDDSATISHAVTGGDYAGVTVESVVVTVDDDETADTTAPRVASIVRETPTSSPTNADSLTWRVTFSEAVSNVDAADFVVSGTTATVTAVAAVSGVTGAYDVTASGGNLASVSATVALTISSSHNIQDGASNDLTNTAPTGTNDNSYVLDNTAPTVTISGVPSASNAPFTATFTFSEAVTGFAVGDITLTNATVSNFTATSTTVYTALVTPTAAGAVTVDVPANAAQDAVGNGNTAATLATTIYTPPAITIVAGTSPVTEGTSAVFTLSRAGSTTAALTVNVTVSETGGDMVAASNEGARTVAFLANSATVTLSIATASDSVDEANSVVTATISADTGSPVSYSVGTPSSAMVTVQDNDIRDVTVSTAALTVNEGTMGTYTVVLDSEPTANVTVTPSRTGSSDVTFSPATLTFTALNWNTVQPVTVTAAQDNDAVDDSATISHAVTGGDYAGVTVESVVVTVDDDETADTTAPRVASIVRETPTSSPTNADSLTWRVTFSEAVSNVDAADFVVSGTTATVTAVAAVSGVTGAYDVTASGGNLAGVSATVGLAIATSHNIQDGASNALSNTVPTGTNDNSYVVDNTAPTVTISGVPATSDAPFTATFTFPEAVTGFAVGDITLGNATASSFTSTSTTVYAALVTPTATGAVTVDVPANAAQDAAGNGNTAATRATSTYTGTAALPAITIAAGASPVTEGTSAVFTLSRTGSTTDALTVNVTVSEAGGDMVAASNEGDRTVTFLTNSTTVTLSIATASDSVAEANSVVTATISADTGSPASYSVGAPGSAMVTVRDDDSNITVPGAPTDLSASAAGETQINLSWTAPTDDGGSPIIGYKIEVSPDGAANWTELVANTGNTSTTYAHIGLAVGTTRHYRVSAINSVGAGDPSNIDDATTRPITGPITGGGGGGGGGGPTPSEVDFEWNVKRDIEELDGGNDRATGVWSDGTTLWVADNADGADDSVYAYDLATGERVESREFALADTNRAPRGIWSDGETVWVSDSGRERLFAYRLADGERVEEREFALAEGNSDARGIWSDEETMWVLDGRADALFAYDFESGELLAEYALDAANDDPHGIWSDGVTIWVSDHGAKRLIAYRLPVLPDAETDSGAQGADDDARELERVRDEEFSKLSRASNNSPRGIWSDGDVMYVADESDDRVYSYNMPDAADARLASLTLSGVDIGEFDPGRTEYEAVVADGVTATTVEAEAMQRRTDVAIDPPDADGDDANGHQIALAGLAEVIVTVTSQDGSRSKTYRVRFPETGWDPGRDPWPYCLRGAVSEGFSLVVHEGGSVEELIGCAESRGIVALYALHEGVYVSHILGAPDFVNAGFLELFPDGLPPITPLVAASNGPPSADPFGDLDDGGQQPWPQCLRGAVAAGFSLVVYEGGSVDELEACARNMDITSLYTLSEGEFVSYILGAPDFVTQPFRDLFADGLPLMTPLVARSEGPPGGR